MKSRYPFMSIVSANMTSPLLRAVWISWVNMSAVSVVELPLHTQNWENRVRVCLLRKYMSLSAMIFSWTLPMHSNSWIRR
jgi:hypothetical protein